MKGERSIVFCREQSSLIPAPSSWCVLMERMGFRLVILPDLKYLKRISCDIRPLTLDLRWSRLLAKVDKNNYSAGLKNWGVWKLPQRIKGASCPQVCRSCGGCRQRLTPSLSPEWMMERFPDGKLLVGCPREGVKPGRAGNQHREFRFLLTETGKRRFQDLTLKGAFPVS